jgi:hypothetical protein
MYLMEWITLLKKKENKIVMNTHAQFQKFFKLLFMAKNLMEDEDA